MFDRKVHFDLNNWLYYLSNDHSIDWQNYDFMIKINILFYPKINSFEYHFILNKSEFLEDNQCMVIQDYISFEMNYLECLNQAKEILKKIENKMMEKNTCVII